MRSTNYHIPRKRKKKQGFNPTREYVAISVDQYFQMGGKITPLVITSSTPIDYRIPSSAADSFLL